VEVTVEVEAPAAGGGEEEDDDRDEGSLGSVTEAADFLLVFLGAGIIGAAGVEDIGSSFAFAFPLSTLFPWLC
jgi:hypothetical protein